MGVEGGYRGKHRDTEMHSGTIQDVIKCEMSPEMSPTGSCLNQGVDLLWTCCGSGLDLVCTRFGPDRR